MITFVPSSFACAAARDMTVTNAVNPTTTHTQIRSRMVCLPFLLSLQLNPRRSLSCGTFPLSLHPSLLDTTRCASDFTVMSPLSVSRFDVDAPPTADLTAAPIGRNASVDVLRGL